MPNWAWMLIKVIWPMFKPIVLNVARWAWLEAESWVESHLDRVPEGQSKGEYKAALFDWKLAQEKETAGLPLSRRNLLREVTHDKMAKK